MHALLQDPLFWKTLIPIISIPIVLIIVFIVVFFVLVRRSNKKEIAEAKEIAEEAVAAASARPDPNAGIDPLVLAAVNAFAEQQGFNEAENLRTTTLENKRINDDKEAQLKLQRLNAKELEAGAEKIRLKTEAEMTAAAIEKEGLEITLADRQLKKARIQRRMTMEETIADLQRRIAAHKLVPKRKFLGII